MKKDLKQLLLQLEANNESYEFYPTSREMIKPIVEHAQNGKFSVLDIGCGTCNFKSHFNELKSQDQSISDYYVIEKSRVLIDRLHKDTIVLGTDFNLTNLIDKKVDIVFCNPPYSEFKEWTKRIIWESNCKYIYLVIPQRWKENAEINRCIEETKASVQVLGSFDFLHAERQARAKVDVLYINKQKRHQYGGYEDLSEINEDAFSRYFDETFKMRDKQNNYEKDLEKEQKEEIKTKLVNCESKAKMLVEIYQNEQKILFEHFQAISSLDVDVLETIGIKKGSVKEALKQKIKSLKILYWKLVFDELEEITSRLTSTTRNNMLDKFKNLLTVDFTIENIYPLILWVIKNANTYYNDQLIDFFKKLSSPENVRAYKSNQKTFSKDRWRFTDEHSHYTLDYRIVCSHIFRTSGLYDDKLDNWDNQKLIDDICTIANNLGFEAGLRESPEFTGEKYNVLMKNSNVLFEYRVYKNRNTHIKLNKEFAKAINVEVSRLLGWIRTKEDIEKEFPPEMAKGAEKYFKVNNFISLNSSNIKLLGMKETA